MTKRLEVGKEYWIKAKLVSVDGRGLPYELDFYDGPTYWFPGGIEAVEAIPEREKVTIPKFVAEWIERCKKYDYDLRDTLDEGIEQSSHVISDWLTSDDNQSIIARAWLEGYEVETPKEPLYTVEIPDPNCVSATTYLEKMGDGKVTIGGEFYYDCVKDNDWKRRDSAQLTESEIKKDFEWAWPFAVPVEEE